jgi:hypothetical protein
MKLTFEEMQRFKEKIKEPIDKKLELYVHDDIDCLFNKTTIPYAFKQNAEVYIMQESRVVFVGTKINAINKISRDRGKLLKSCFPKISLLDGTILE